MLIKLTFLKFYNWVSPGLYKSFIIWSNYGVWDRLSMIEKCPFPSGSYRMSNLNCQFNDQYTNWCVIYPVSPHFVSSIAFIVQWSLAIIICITSCTRTKPIYLAAGRFQHIHDLWLLVVQILLSFTPLEWRYLLSIQHNHG